MFLFCLIRLISANQFLKKVQMFNNNTKIQGTTIRTPCCKCVSMPLYERFCTWTPWGTYEVNVTFYSGSSTFESLLFIDLIYNAWFRIHDLTNCHCLVYHRKNIWFISLSFFINWNTLKGPKPRKVEITWANKIYVLVFQHRKCWSLAHCKNTFDQFCCLRYQNNKQNISKC